LICAIYGQTYCGVQPECRFSQDAIKAIKVSLSELGGGLIKFADQTQMSLLCRRLQRFLENIDPD